MDNQPISLSDWDELGGFDTQEPPGHYFSPFDGDGKLVGLSCHHACLMLLLDHFKYKLKLSDAQPLQAGLQWHAYLMGVDYGGMLQYQDQVKGCCSLLLCIQAEHLQLTVAALDSSSPTSDWQMTATCG